MLTSSIGKSTQIDFAKQETKKALDLLVSDSYNLTNLSLIKFLMDIMNQYCNGVNNVKSVRGCLNEYKYLVALEKEGKLSALTFVDLTSLQGLKYVPEYGKHFWTIPNSDLVVNNIPKY